MTTINITPPNIQTLTIPVVGKTPLIVHKFDAKARLQLMESGTKKSKGAPREARDPEGSYKRSLYVMKDGRYGFPAAGFKAAAVRAAKNVSGLTMTDARALFYIESDGVDEMGNQLVAISGEPEMREDVVRLQGSSTDLRWRGQFTEWSANLTIQYDADLISPDSIGSLIMRAGLTVGVGEWRPEKNGSFGTFTIQEG